jgi:hypothetical protein
MLTITNNIGPSESEILSCTDQNKDRDNLWTQYRSFYEDKRKQYEESLRELGTMDQHNREIPFDLAEKIKSALLKQEYVVAKTMPNNPHQYCLRKKWIGDITFTETVNTMREYGYVEWFYNRQFMVYNVGELKYWTMGYPIEVTTLINRTTIEKYTFEDFCNLVRGI